MKKTLTFLFAAFLYVSSMPAWAEEGSLTDAQRAEVEKIVERLLMEKPELIIEALRKYEKQQAQAEREQQAAAIEENLEQIENDPGDPIMGNPQGDVTLVEFFDYACGYCKRVYPALEKMIADDPKLRMVMKEFPILGEASVFAAKVSLSAKRQGKYPEFHKALMELRGSLKPDVILTIAKDVGLDMEQVKTDMDSLQVNATIQRNLQLARKLGINGTPSFVISGILIPGAVPADELKQMVELTRAHGKSQ